MRRTRRAIQGALVELLLEKGYDKVTVTDIIERADVGRSTFYANFTDKQDVLRSNLDELGFLHPAPAAEGPLFAFSLPMIEHVAEQRQLVRALLGKRGGGAVMAHGEKLLGDVIREELLVRGWQAPEPVVTCVVGAFLALLTKWVDGEISATPAELDAAFRAVIIPGVEAAAGVAIGA
ncbi:TetR/AcrR family transcriptional regulator [Nonomuraea sediminis]|uniref:TetR/AcrR family transcriptional regulator n=1 Tax=Nonomuraea sediminis TaxID=2835864 RepID=UPI001BDD59B8|nr:TetR/AcrR family transcriptional regulator [Nonomuraea sediminis]